jgi:precorrin-6B C5,15-methyltransferase / cobalt-precorrin-6B C5,C15-methyltransferase
MLPADLTDLQPAALTRWLSIVGIGEDGIEGLSAAARELIRAADFVFGAPRHLALAAPLIRGEPRAWGVPFDSTMAAVLTLRGQAVCVLASGDPLNHGAGALLARHLSSEEVVVCPAPSAYSLAAARLLWALPEVALVSLCGHPFELLRPKLHPGRRILALTAGRTAPAELASWLHASGFGPSRLTILECLGGAQERVRSALASTFNLDAVGALNTVAIEVAQESHARLLPRAAGLADSLFEHDGQITKREIRALTLSALAPLHGQRLWDVGSGSGSVAIEWLLADDSLEAIAIEQRPDRAQRIARNAAACGARHLSVIEGAAPSALSGLKAPDAVFVGGGASAPHLIETVQAALRPQGRLVVNAVSLETESLLLHNHARFGGSLTRMSFAHSSPLGGADGRMQGWRPAMPVTQWVWVKP